MFKVRLQQVWLSDKGCDFLRLGTLFSHTGSSMMSGLIMKPFQAKKGLYPIQEGEAHLINTVTFKQYMNFGEDFFKL